MLCTGAAAGEGAAGQAVRGYESHTGRTEGADRARPFATVDGRDEGAVSEDGRVSGSYLHGMFRDDGFRRAWLAALGAEVGNEGYDATVEAVLDRLADHIETHLDVDGLSAVAR